MKFLIQRLILAIALQTISSNPVHAEVAFDGETVDGIPLAHVQSELVASRNVRVGRNETEENGIGYELDETGYELDAPASGFTKRTTRLRVELVFDYALV